MKKPERHQIPQRVLEKIDSLCDPSGDSDRCLYLYDLAQVHLQLDKLKRNLPEQVQVYYAVKANPHPRILEELSKDPYIKGVEIASEGEFATCNGPFLPDQIIYTGPAKTRAELRTAVANGLRQVHVESLTEIDRLEQCVIDEGAEPVDLLVRLNADFNFQQIDVPLSAQMAGKASKFGIDEADYPAVVARLAETDRLNARGIHIFGGSGILSAEDFLRFTDYCFSRIRDFESEHGPIDCIDLGGGFGIDYTGEHGELDIVRIGQGLAELIDQYAFGEKEIILELGRYIVGECGHYLAPIVDIKRSKRKAFLLTAGGLNHFRRHHDHGINHPTRVIPGNTPPYLRDPVTVRRETVDVGGPLCTPRDFIARDLFVEEAKVGDFILISMVGAYGLSFSPGNFLSHPVPEEIFF